VRQHKLPLSNAAEPPQLALHLKAVACATAVQTKTNPALRISRTMRRVSLDQNLDLPAAQGVEIAQKIELERRWKAFEQSPDEGEPWDEVKRSLLSE
jgi:putative addiction module component (TIGR02574 family)